MSSCSYKSVNGSRCDKWWIDDMSIPGYNRTARSASRCVCMAPDGKSEQALSSKKVFLLKRKR